MELDHVFILCDEGAPEAEALLRLGVREGSSNTHPGQGTACRRFFFANAYLELGWVGDPAEAGSDAVKRTRLLDRWALRRAGACPFGIIMRPTAGEACSVPPFPVWRYAPSYFPEGMALDIAEGTLLSEPEVFYFAVGRNRGGARREPLDHAIPAMALRRVTIGGPVPDGLSSASRALVASGVVTFEVAPTYTLTLDFSAAPDAVADLRPGLPLVLRW